MVQTGHLFAPNERDPGRREIGGRLAKFGEGIADRIVGVRRPRPLKDDPGVHDGRLRDRPEIAIYEQQRPKLVEISL